MTKLSRAVIACISATMMLLGVASIARADTVPLIDDPLHGHCLAGCVSNGTNTPIIGPTSGLYFQASPGPQTGLMLVEVLMPNNITPTGGGFGVSASGGSKLLPVGEGGGWTSGTLGGFLVAHGSYVTPDIKPTNPINAFLPATLAFDPTATGYWVYEALMGVDPRTL